MKQKRHWSKRVRWGRLLLLLAVGLWVGFSWPTYQPPTRPACAPGPPLPSAGPFK